MWRNNQIIYDVIKCRRTNFKYNTKDKLRNIETFRETNKTRIWRNNQIVYDVTIRYRRTGSSGWRTMTCCCLLRHRHCWRTGRWWSTCMTSHWSWSSRRRSGRTGLWRNNWIVLWKHKTWILMIVSMDITIIVIEWCFEHTIQKQVKKYI